MGHLQHWLILFGAEAPPVRLRQGNFLDGSVVGKGGARYGKHAGLCLETQVGPAGADRE
jgi:hypothetical protein